MAVDQFDLFCAVREREWPYKPVILAPMAGVTDLPFRRVVRHFGTHMVFSEMVASQAVIRTVKRTGQMMEMNNDQCTAVQLVGADPKIMAYAAALVCNMGVRHININFGCPVRKVVNTDAGSAIMKDERRAASIMEAVVRAVNVPVSVKMRLGWDDAHMNAKAIAKIAEGSGIAMITVHGRTRQQMFAGKANWAAIAEIKGAVSIPVVVNGDITDVTTARTALVESGADGIMIGRGALGSPWILSEIQDAINQPNMPNAQTTPHQGITLCSTTATMRIQTAKTHADYMFEFYEPRTAIHISRRVVGYYLKWLPNIAHCRRMLSSLNSRDQINELLDTLLARIGVQ
ncbi:MAG: tRNA dihydrouridine synthase DusB [Holosporales bacterium]|jgi:tRNA-dihydrouridine synthase B|nr:tRNA dihydrouridine synthase DusB [Holosporales bacterium]